MASALSPYQPHSLEHGSVEDKYENRLLLSDVRFGNNNRDLFSYLKESTRGTNFAYPINTYERTRNDFAAWLALNTHHSGESKWREQIKTDLSYVSGTKWYGSTNIIL